MTPSDLTIVQDDLTGAAVVALLAEHLAAMHESSPPGSVHALDVAGLRAPAVSFWTAWDGAPGSGDLAGCAALQELSPTHGELKSFRTGAAHLRRGVASALLTHLLDVARGCGYVRLSLETGSGPAFDAAHALYQRYGFTACGPFADYAEDPFSRYYTHEL